jgi:hypothetical protein
MKKTLYSAIFTIATISIITSCKKSSTKEEVIDPVKFYSQKFMTDQSFTTFFKTMVSNSFKINKLKADDKAISSDNAYQVTDTTSAYDYVAETVTAQVLMKADNPGFFELSLDQQVQVMSQVCSNLALESYRQAHSTTPLVIYATETLDYLNHHGPTMNNQTIKVDFIDITWGEFAGCTTAALGAALGEYGGVIGDVWRLLSEGSQYLTWGGVFQIAKRVIRNAVPWYKVASVAIGYATCLWSVA